MITQQKQQTPSSITDMFSKSCSHILKQEYSQATEQLFSLAHSLLQNLKIHKNSVNEGKLKKYLSECYLQMAICEYYNSSESNSLQICVKLLESSLEMNCLNIFAYYNLSSLHFINQEYQSSLSNLCCALSSLYLHTCGISPPKQKETYLNKSIQLCQSNLQAHLMRLVIYLKNKKYSIAINELNWCLQIDPNNPQLIAIRERISLDQHINRDNLLFCLENLGSFVQKGILGRLNCSYEYEEEHVKQEITERNTEFSRLFEQFSAVQHPMWKLSITQVSLIKCRSFLISNEKTSSQPFRLSESSHSKDSLQLSLHNSSLFSLSKSNNNLVESVSPNRTINSKLLSSIDANDLNQRNQQSKYNHDNLILENEDQYLVGSSSINHMRKKVDIEIVQSQIEVEQGQIEGEVYAIADKVEEDELLLDSVDVYEGVNENTITPSLVEGCVSGPLSKLFPKQSKPNHKSPNNSSLIDSKQFSNSSLSISKTQPLYPLTQNTKILEIIVSKIQIQSPTSTTPPFELYCILLYNKNMLQIQKFKSRLREHYIEKDSKRVYNQEQSLGVVAISQQPRGLCIKLYKSKPEQYHDELLGQGQIEIITLGMMRIPVYRNCKNIGKITLQLVLPKEELLRSYQGSGSISMSCSEGNQSFTISK